MEGEALTGPTKTLPGGRDASPDSAPIAHLCESSDLFSRVLQLSASNDTLKQDND